MLGAMRKRIRRGERGQIMILGALGVLLVALMMLLTLNVGQSVFEKIRIQQLSDSSAFSVATQQARAFNFFAYTNRANVGSLVAAASAHGYMSMASTVPKLFEAGGYNHIFMAIEEIGLCCACSYCSCVQHCIHAGKDFKAASKYFKEAKKLRKKVKNLDKMFIQVIQALDLHMRFISFSQQEMKLRVGMQIMTDKLTKDLRDKFAPQASNNATGITALNLIEFSQVFEGDEKKKKWIPTEVANGTRWKKFVFKRDFFTPFLFLLGTSTWNKFFSEIPPGGGMSLPLGHTGQSRIIKGANSPKPRITSDNEGPDGDAAAAWDNRALVFSFMSNNCIPFSFWPYKAWVGSSDDSGDHEPSNACAGKDKHKNFKCLAGGDCFTLFKANSSSSANFGQPVVYSLITQDLRMMPKGGQGPWEISDSGEISVDLGGDIGKKKMQISDDPGKFGKGMALSKALVYYHLPTDWKEHPNFFNPFWRAKLQPFKGSAEAIKVLTMGGAGKYIPAVIAGAPLP